MVGVAYYYIYGWVLDDWMSDKALSMSDYLISGKKSIVKGENFSVKLVMVGNLFSSHIYKY